MHYRTWTLLLGLMLAMPARALDIEPIAVRSALGEPLRAEIPVKASPEELRDLQAGLAPAVVFARVGLPRPSGAVAGLRFAVRDAGGQPVIRVTTREPVDEEFFTFLIQLEWDSGRMTREFSVALQPSGSRPATPSAVRLADTAPAAAPEPAPLPRPAPVDAIEILPDTGVTVSDSAPSAPPSVAPIPLQAPARAVAASPPTQVPTRAATTPSPPARAPAATPPESKSPPRPPQRAEPASSQPAAPTPAPAPGTDGYGPVKSGETLSRVAARIDGGGAMHEQALAALLLTNPDAFIDGNINRLKRGATLRMPSPSTLAAIDPAHARELVRLQARQWSEGRDAVPESEMADALATVKADMQKTAARKVAPVPLAPARLEIAPPESPDTADHTDPGSSHTLTPEATALDDEVLASRDSEIEYLKQRMTELETSRDELQRVIALQDQALATAQTRLKQTDGRGLVSVRSPWFWAGIAGLLIVGMLIGTRLRRTGTASTGNGSARRPPRWHRP